MSQSRCNRRRRTQAAQGFRHIHRQKRPKYCKTSNSGGTKGGAL